MDFPTPLSQGPDLGLGNLEIEHVFISLNKSYNLKLNVQLHFNCDAPTDYGGSRFKWFAKSNFFLV